MGTCISEECQVSTPSGLHTPFRQSACLLVVLLKWSVSTPSGLHTPFILYHTHYIGTPSVRFQPRAGSTRLLDPSIICKWRNICWFQPRAGSTLLLDLNAVETWIDSMDDAVSTP